MEQQQSHAHHQDNNRRIRSSSSTHSVSSHQKHIQSSNTNIIFPSKQQQQQQQSPDISQKQYAASQSEDATATRTGLPKTFELIQLKQQRKENLVDDKGGGDSDNNQKNSQSRKINSDSTFTFDKEGMRLRLRSLGHRTFLWKGFLNFGSQGRMQLGSFMGLFVPSLLFVCFVEMYEQGLQQYFAAEDSYLWRVIAVSVIGLTLFLFLLSSFSDPGFIAVPLTKKARRSLPAVQIRRGKTFELRWCSTCDIARPLRTHHCRECDLCVMERDHHCPFLNNCIGKHNRRTYLFFLLCSVLLELMILCETCFQIAQAIRYDVSFLSAISRASVILAFLQAIYALILASNLMSLLLFQLRLAVKNCTTDEYRRLVVTTPKQIDIDLNATFDNGCLRNLQAIFFAETLDREPIYAHHERVSYDYLKKRLGYYTQKAQERAEPHEDEEYDDNHHRHHHRMHQNEEDWEEQKQILLLSKSVEPLSQQKELSSPLESNQIITPKASFFSIAILEGNSSLSTNNHNHNNQHNHYPRNTNTNISHSPESILNPNFEKSPIPTRLSQEINRQDIEAINPKAQQPSAASAAVISASVIEEFDIENIDTKQQQSPKQVLKNPQQQEAERMEFSKQASLSIPWQNSSQGFQFSQIVSASAAAAAATTTTPVNYQAHGNNNNNNSMLISMSGMGSNTLKNREYYPQRISPSLSRMMSFEKRMQMMVSSSENNTPKSAYYPRNLISAHSHKTQDFDSNVVLYDLPQQFSKDSMIASAGSSPHHHQDYSSHPFMLASGTQSSIFARTGELVMQQHQSQQQQQQAAVVSDTEKQPPWLDNEVDPIESTTNQQNQLQLSYRLQAAVSAADREKSNNGLNSSPVNNNTGRESISRTQRSSSHSILPFMPSNSHSKNITNSKRNSKFKLASIQQQGIPINSTTINGGVLAGLGTSTTSAAGLAESFPMSSSSSRAGSIVPGFHSSPTSDTWKHAIANKLDHSIEDQLMVVANTTATTSGVISSGANSAMLALAAVAAAAATAAASTGSQKERFPTSLTASLGIGGGLAMSQSQQPYSEQQQCLEDDFNVLNNQSISGIYSNSQILPNVNHNNNNSNNSNGNNNNNSNRSLSNLKRNPKHGGNASFYERFLKQQLLGHTKQLQQTIKRNNQPFK